jgi:hypothetical protein
MIRRVGLVSVLASIASFALAAPSSASAATTVGQTFVPTIGNTCNGGPEWEVVQTGRADGTSYAAPSAGVLTSWSFEASGVQTVLTLRAFHPTGTPHQYKVIADGGALQTIAASSGLHTFPTQIPVVTGDLIGIHSTSGTCASSTGSIADTYDYRFATATPVGGINTYTNNDGFIWDIAARLEPDCNHNGLGDETQDPNVSGPGCPATGQRAAALASCKKRAHKHHWSHKRRKKCKKHANSLPA